MATQAAAGLQPGQRLLDVLGALVQDELAAHALGRPAEGRVDHHHRRPLVVSQGLPRMLLAPPRMR